MGVIELKPDDLTEIHGIVHSAFPADEAELISVLVTHLISQKSDPKTYCYGHEIDKQIVSVICFSPVFDQSSEFANAYILSPLAVNRDFQKQKLGSQLIRFGLDRLKIDGVEILLVYGDPAYYDRFGFTPNLAKKFEPPFPLEFEFGWQALQLSNADISNPKIKIKCVDALSIAALW